MVDPTQKSGPKVTLEQLIQLKRAERPSPEYWEDFDRELHRRQLAALVTIDPWHRRAARVLVAAARRLAPVGAGAAALALAALALMRVDSTGPATVEPADAIAAADAESRVVLLPEESITVSTRSTPPPAMAVEEFRGHVRSAPQELASGLATARRFVTVSAPVTFSSGNDSSAIYSANALKAGTVLRSLAAVVPESL